MKPHKETIVARNSKVAWQGVDDKVIVVTPHTKRIHILSGSGRSIWGYLKDQKRLKELIDLLCNEYDISPVQVEKDISDFIQQLEEKEIVSLTSREDFERNQ